MSPEYPLDGLFSTKSDIFSFGVLMLEIISGKKNTGFYSSEQVPSLLGYVCNMFQLSPIVFLLFFPFFVIFFLSLTSMKNVPGLETMDGE